MRQFNRDNFPLQHLPVTSLHKFMNLHRV